jgi:hypothetical protein
MEQIVCRYCKGKNPEDNIKCSTCGVELEKPVLNKAKKLQITVNPWLLGMGVLVLLIIAISLATNGSQKAATSSVAEDTTSNVETPVAPVDPLDGHCAGLTYAIDETTSVLGGGGSTSTLDDILSVLKKNGNLFAGYSQLVTEPNAASVIQDASTEMLQIRVGLTTGADIQTIQDICQ